MIHRTGAIIGDGLAREIEDHHFTATARHFSLPETTDCDRHRLVAELWSDMARVGPLWSNVRVFYEGHGQHPSRFMHGRISDGLIVHSSLNVNAIAQYLDSGATLIYNHLHESSYCIQRIQEILEYRLGIRTWIQAYLTKANETAFGLHRDDHNFVVLQLLGSKSWEVESVDSAPTRRLLHAGDGIFLRSETEHAVSGVGELSLHLTIAFDWLATTPAQPGSALSDDERRAHEKACRSGSVLPVALDPATLEPTMSLRSVGRVRPVVHAESDHVSFGSVAGQFRFDRRLAPVLELLCDGGETNVLELTKVSGLSESQIEQFVLFAIKKRILLCSL